MVNQSKTPDSVNRAANHRLLVEGEFDQIFMEALFDEIIPVGRLGSRNILIVGAKAFSMIEPNFYFLIDRDHHSDEEVDSFWQKFPVANEPNILIWRRKELENYLIEPDVFCSSKSVTASKEQVTARLLEIVQGQIYFDTARLVVSEIRRNHDKSLNQAWGKFNKTMINHTNSINSIECIAVLIADLKSPETLKEFTETWLVNKYQEKFNLMTGGADTIEIGKGKWHELIQGKTIFNTLFHEFFKSPIPHKDHRHRQFAKDVLYDIQRLHPDILEVKNKISAVISPFPA
ncbi:MAG: hypothetical protein QM523_07135 [Candidatus Pacebacteria bacterium]|nr:hypothetical protein [Candidatus Paceibacterota bacterium]